MPFTAKVPLQAQQIVRRRVQGVKVWVDGDYQVVESPLRPYFYTDKAPPEDLGQTTEVVERTTLMTRQKGTWYKTYFANTKDLEFGENWLKSPEYEGPPLQIAHKMDNVMSLIIQESDGFFFQFPQTKPLKVLTLDIEQFTTGNGVFPEADAPMISMAWAIDDEPVQFLHCERTSADGVDILDDRNLVVKFIQIMREADPDIVVGFNHSEYDIGRVLLHKVSVYGYKDEIFGREEGRSPMMYTKRAGQQQFTVFKAGGRVYFDVYHAVLGDQSLNGVRKGLKTVLKHFLSGKGGPKFRKDYGLVDYEVVEEDTKNTSLLVGTEKLEKYNKSDVIGTRALFKMYFKNIISIAEFTGCPIGNVVPLATSYPFTQVLGTIFRDMKIISDGNNFWRYKSYYDYFKKHDVKFKGAYVECFKTGLFKNIFEYDVASLYPNLMAALGIGPDNTRIIGTRAYQTDVEVYNMGSDRLFLVPDPNLQWTWEIEVVGRSVVAEKILELLKLRMKLKKEWEETKDEGLFALAYGLKVVLNSLYGLNGSPFNPFGELGVAIITTGMGRKVLKIGEYVIGYEHLLLEDTDGIKCARQVSVEDLDRVCNDYLESNAQGLRLISFEESKYDALWSLKMKNYLLMKDGKMTIHGNSFKSSKYPPMFDEVMRRVATVLLKGGDARKEALKCLNLKQYESQDFILRVRTNKPIEEYEGKNPLPKTIALKAKESLGIEPKVGRVYEYIKIKEGKVESYSVNIAKDLNKLDKDYYIKVIESALKRLGLENVQQESLSKWFG